MSRIAVISDIHGNMSALAAVLAEANVAGAQQVICLGDLTGYGPFPNEVIGVIRSLRMPCVLGNYDDAIAFDRDDCGCFFENEEARETGILSFAWTKDAVWPENKRFMRGLPREIRGQVDGFRFLFVHGSPRRINEYLFEDAPEAVFQEIAASSEADVIVYGHTHKAYVKSTSGVKFANAGSVGKPKDGDSRACFAIIETGGDSIEVEFRRVAYDIGYVASTIRRHGLPLQLADQLEQGW